jgi:hypothetical protein
LLLARIRSQNIGPANSANGTSRIGITPQHKTATWTLNDHHRVAFGTDFECFLRESFLAKHVKVTTGVGAEGQRRHVGSHGLHATKYDYAKGATSSGTQYIAWSMIQGSFASMRQNLRQSANFHRTCDIVMRQINPPNKHVRMRDLPVISEKRSDSVLRAWTSQRAYRQQQSRL